jgi:hypothetical protein
MFKNSSDFVNDEMRVESLISYAKADEHDFDRDHSNPCIISVGFIDVPKEIGVRIQLHANSVNE